MKKNIIVKKNQSPFIDILAFVDMKDISVKDRLTVTYKSGKLKSVVIRENGLRESNTIEVDSEFKDKKIG